MKPSKKDLQAIRDNAESCRKQGMNPSGRYVMDLLDLVEAQQAIVDKILWHEETLGGTPTYILDLAKNIKYE